MAESNKPGRPRLNPEEKKQSFNLSLYPSQIEEYLRQATAKGLDRNEYLVYKLHLNSKKK